MFRKSSAIRLVVVLAVLSLVVSIAASKLAAEETQHQGFFIGAQSGRIAILSHDGMATRVFPLANLVKVTRNAHDADIRQLVRGDIVQLTTETWFGNEFVIAVAAMSSE